MRTTDTWIRKLRRAVCRNDGSDRGESKGDPGVGMGIDKILTILIPFSILLIDLFPVSILIIYFFLFRHIEEFKEKEAFYFLLFSSFH